MRPVWIASTIFALVMFALGTIKFASYRAGSDVGLFVQALSSPTLSNSTEGGSHFLFHFSPALYIVAPLVASTHSALALIAVAAVASALTAPALYLFARKRLPEACAVTSAITALVYPPLVGVTFADFHENVFVVPLTLWLLWAVDARRWLAAAIFFALLLGVKEDQALILACAALYALVYFSRRGERTGTTLSSMALVLCVVTLATYFGAIRPAIGGGAWSPTHFYDWNRHVGANQTAPLFSFGRLTYLLEAFGPLLFLSLLSPLAVLSVPGFAEVLLSHESMTYTMGQHYAAVWIAYVLGAFALGLSAIAVRRPARALTLTRISLAVCGIILLAASPTHWGHYLALPSAHEAELDRAIASLPPDAEVAAPDEIFSHLGFLPRATLGVQGEPKYVLIDSTHTNSTLAIRDLPAIRQKVAAGTYERIVDRDGIELFRRRDVAR